MAIFKFKDRAKRAKSQPLQESALLTAEEAWFYSDSAKPAQMLNDAFRGYTLHTEQLGIQPYTREVFEKKFRKRMLKAGFTV